jgi:hypothetical protein
MQDFSTLFVCEYNGKRKKGLFERKWKTKQNLLLYRCSIVVKIFHTKFEKYTYTKKGFENVIDVDFVHYSCFMLAVRMETDMEKVFIDISGCTSDLLHMVDENEAS